MNARLAKQKAKNDMALNLSELAVVTGYGRSTLQAMHLPLVHGKIRLRDFWRVIREWQDRIMAPPYPLRLTAASRETHSMQATVDKFRAPSPSRAGSSSRCSQIAGY
jgi:hypothetical protein